MAASYNGWPASSSPSRIGINTTWEPIPGHRFPAGVKSGDVQTIFTYLVKRLDAEVEPIEYYRPGDEWGYYYKASANSPNLLSCHSSGTAIDYNATRHPNGRRGTWTTTQVRKIRQILQDLDGVVRWLYDATRTPDEMHFEIRGSAYTVAQVARRLRGQPAPTPTPISQEFTMDAEARAAFAAVTERINDVAAGVMIAVGAVHDLDDDVPANVAAILKELRVNQRATITALNGLLVAAGKPPIKIVIGYNGSTPIYQQ